MAKEHSQQAKGKGVAGSTKIEAMPETPSQWVGKSPRQWLDKFHAEGSMATEPDFIRLRTQTQVSFEKNPARFLEKEIQAYILENPCNCLKDIDSSPMFEEPLVGFADGDDPIFQNYKTVIGDFHLTPREVLEKHRHERQDIKQPKIYSCSVICIVLPIAKTIRLSNRKMTEVPSREWNNVRWLGQLLNENLARHLISLLEEKGYQAVAPGISLYEVRMRPNGRRAANWSHRHAAYAAGLGTFGLTDGLITPKGAAIRLNSIVTDLKLPATPRTYGSYIANCLFLVDGSCGECMKRCPGGAITAQGHDPGKCLDNINGMNYLLEKPGYMGTYAACGLCQTKVPCEAQIPRIKGMKH